MWYWGGGRFSEVLQVSSCFWKGIESLPYVATVFGYFGIYLAPVCMVQLGVVRCLGGPWA